MLDISRKFDVFLRSIILGIIFVLSGTAMADSVTGIDNVTLENPNSSRIVTIGKEITETVFALGKGNHVVGRDLTSAYPPKVQNIPNVGYINNLGAEGIISKNPTLVIVNDITPPITIKQLRSADIPVLKLKTPQNTEDILENIGIIGDALNTPQKANDLQDKLKKDMAKAKAFINNQREDLRAIILVGRPGHGVATLGQGGGARLYAPFIKLLGAKNVADFNGLKHLNAESLVRLAPNTLLFINRSTGTLEQAGGKQAILNQPEFALTPAGQQGRLFEIDDHSITFGPDLGKNLLEVAKKVYPQ